VYGAVVDINRSGVWCVVYNAETADVFARLGSLKEAWGDWGQLFLEPMKGRNLLGTYATSIQHHDAACRIPHSLTDIWCLGLDNTTEFMRRTELDFVLVW
jgi:hypothetical protein